MTDSTPSQRATRWLADFAAALAAGQAQRAAAMFDADCYWRVSLKVAFLQVVEPQ